MSRTAEPVVDLPGVRFAVDYVGADGVARREPLEACTGVRFERAPAVRSFRFAKGMSSFAGWWWFAASGEHVGDESWLERDHVMLMDFDPAVVAVASQPFWLSWHDGRRRRRHAPDFFARRSNGSGVVVDVRPDDRIPQREAEGLAVTAQACVQAGWEFRGVGVPGSGLDAGLLRTFAMDTPLLAGAEATGDRLQVLPVLFHLMWQGRLVASEFTSAPLGAATMVRTARG